jgi:hypothetical protein
LRLSDDREIATGLSVEQSIQNSHMPLHADAGSNESIRISDKCALQSHLNLVGPVGAQLSATDEVPQFILRYPQSRWTKGFPHHGAITEVPRPPQPAIDKHTYGRMFREGSGESKGNSGAPRVAHNDCSRPRQCFKHAVNISSARRE